MNNPAFQVGFTTSTSDIDSFVGSFSDSANCDEFSSGRTSPVPGDSSSEGCLSVDAGSEIWSSLPITPTIRRIFVWELETASVSFETKKVLNKVDQDAKFPSTRSDCHDALPTREACDYHTQINLLHDG